MKCTRNNIVLVKLVKSTMHFKVNSQHNSLQTPNTYWFVPSPELSLQTKFLEPCLGWCLDT